LSTPAPERFELSQQTRRLLLPGLVLTEALAAIHALAIVSVMPAISSDLHGQSLYGAVFSAFLLASIIGMVVAGRLVDTMGLSRPLQLGFVAFVLGLAASGLAPTMWALVAARAVEGFGAGMVIPMIYASVNTAYDEKERPRVFAYISAGWVIPSLGGALLAAWVAETFGWRWVFLGVAPFAALALGMLIRPLREVESARRSAPAQTRTMSLMDAFGIAVGVGIVLWVLEEGALLAIVIAVPLAGFIALRSTLRVLPRGTFAIRSGLPAAIAIKGIIVFSFFGADAYLPLALVELNGASLEDGGTVISMGALSWTLGTWMQTRFLPLRAGTAVWIGSVLVAVGIASFAASVLIGASLPWSIAAWMVAGYGMGMTYVTTNTSAMAHTREGEEGATSSALGLADALAFSVSAGIGGALVAAAERGIMTERLSLSVIWVMVVLVVLVAALFSSRIDGTSRASAGM
jgi:MFS family permease